MSKKRNAKSITGVAWYSRDQWELLQQVASDRDDLHDTYDEWYADFNSSLLKLEQAGIRCIKVPIDVVTLINWCNDRQIPIDGKARSQFTAEKMHSLN